MIVTLTVSINKQKYSVVPSSSFVRNKVDSNSSKVLHMLATNTMMRNLKAIRFIKIASNPVDYAKPQSVQQSKSLSSHMELLITVYIFDSSTIKKTAMTQFVIV